VRSRRQADPSPARPSPGARSARRDPRIHLPADRLRSLNAVHSGASWVLWQQFGNKIARATTTCLQCQRVRHRRKKFGIIGLPTTIQCHGDATLKKGIQVRILVSSLNLNLPQKVGPFIKISRNCQNVIRAKSCRILAARCNDNVLRSDTPKHIGGIGHRRSVCRRTIAPGLQGVLGTETLSSASHRTRADLIQTKIVSHIHEHAAIPWPAASRQWLARRSYPGCFR
jgi:hypothetical protein